MSANTNGDVSRRDFLGKAAGAGFLILKPQTVRGSQANSAIRMGLLGCGARGRAVATSFINNTITRYFALADLFLDQLESARSYFNKLAASKNYAGIEAKLLFRGPAAYRELAVSDEIDAVHIATPGFFHVGHLDAVVAAGKHVYCEKPIGVDVVQALHAMEIGKKAEGRLSLDVGFQIRSAPAIRRTRQAHSQRRARQDRLHQRALSRHRYDIRRTPADAIGRAAPAQLVLGSDYLRRHPGRPEHPRFRHL